MPSPLDALQAVAEDPPTIVCLPDLFLDHLVELPDLERTQDLIEEVHQQGGGNRQAPQSLEAGGNAANTAWQLARLGARVSFVGPTSPLGAQVAASTLGAAGVDLALLDDGGSLALTVALEMATPPTNVMFNDPGSLASFGPDDLGKAARRAIERADAVHVANWQNLHERGTALVAEVSRVSHQAGTRCFLDPSDPTHRADEIPDLMDVLTADQGPHVVAVNEHELTTLAGRSGPVDELGCQLSEHLTGRLDVHSQHAAWSFHEGRTLAEEPGLEVPVARATGAGDAWNAGNLLGDLAGLDASPRLALAHAVAAYHVARGPGRPPADAEAIAQRLGPA